MTQCNLYVLNKCAAPVLLPSCKKKKLNGGYALIMSLFTLTILVVLTTVLVNIMLVDARGATQDVSSIKALQYARAGVARAKSELKNNAIWGTNTASCNGGGYGNYGNCCYSMNDGQYGVTVVPGSNNATSTSKIWKITSTGKQGSSARSITTWLQQDSFAKYAYFTDRELSTSGTVIWFMSRDNISGNAHTNGYFNISGTPHFSKTVDSAQQTDAYWNSGTGIYTQGGQNYTNNTKFYHYYSNYTSDQPQALNGSPDFSFAGAQAVVTLPTDISMIYNNANYRYTGATTIVVKNNCTMDITNGGTTLNKTTPYSGTTVHVTGDVTISGTLCGKMTVGSTGNITIPADLVYKDNNVDVMGLVAAQNIKVEANPYTVADRTIHAAMMALNTSFGVNNYNTGVARGTLHILGGIIQNRRGAVSTFSGNSLVTGYAKDYQYDNKLINTPPPNFPTTGNIKIKSWLDASALQN